MPTTTKPIHYRPLLRACPDYPHNGASVWGVADSLGGFVACRDEASAKAAAMLRNARVGETEDVE